MLSPSKATPPSITTGGGTSAAETPIRRASNRCQIDTELDNRSDHTVDVEIEND